jgi:hypothetical protein
MNYEKEDGERRSNMKYSKSVNPSFLQSDRTKTNERWWLFLLMPSNILPFLYPPSFHPINPACLHGHTSISSPADEEEREIVAQLISLLLMEVGGTWDESASAAIGTNKYVNTQWVTCYIEYSTGSMNKFCIFQWATFA